MVGILNIGSVFVLVMVFLSEVGFDVGVVDLIEVFIGKEF